MIAHVYDCAMPVTFRGNGPEIRGENRVCSLSVKEEQPVNQIRALTRSSFSEDLSENMDPTSVVPVARTPR